MNMSACMHEDHIQAIAQRNAKSSKAQGRIQSLERGGGHLAEKQLKTKKKKKKKVTTIIASDPLPNISRLLCKIKSYL